VFSRSGRARNVVVGRLLGPSNAISAASYCGLAQDPPAQQQRIDVGSSQKRVERQQRGANSPP